MGHCIPLVINERRAWLCVGGPTLSMNSVTGGRVYFEMHPYCGPMRSRQDGSGSSQDFPKWFWPLFEKWMDGGQKVDRYGRCVIESRRKGGVE